MARHLMLVPSLACPASCAYCFGPHEGHASMRLETLDAVIRWQLATYSDDPLEITFHGGEPLVPGAEFYRSALPRLREGLAPRRIRFAMQSNLWLLTDELCEILLAHGVSLGTSLDGPEAINDAQRGHGYFNRTMAGIERARRHGLDVGCICTFTAQSAPRYPEIMAFFIREGLSFTLHAAMPSIRTPGPNPWMLSPSAHGDLMVSMLDLYLENLDRVRISTLDSLCRSVSAGRGGICTFGDCLGGYLAVGPLGEIYACQRFAGLPELQLGHVSQAPGAEDLAASTVWRRFRDREERIEEACGDCPYLSFCRGGCPYNALAGAERTPGTHHAGFLPSQSAGAHELPQASVSSLPRTAYQKDGSIPLRDPHCESYRRIFGAITDRALDEVFAEENLAEVIERPDPQAGLLRRGRILSIMRDGPHPQETAQHARRILAAVALASAGTPGQATSLFAATGLVDSPERTQRGMEALHARLTARRKGLNNLYLHVTFACPLRCTHCYAQAGNPEAAAARAMPVADIVRATKEAAELGFRHSVVTGGEPLVHPQRDALLSGLASLRSQVTPLLTVLRTSLSLPLDDDLLRRIGRSTDEVVVSLDGDRDTHDGRRGAGSYDLVVGNLRRLAEMGYENDLSLATVLPLAQANGPPGDNVRGLARELGIRRTRFRPVLPLGRAVTQEPDVVPETLWAHLGPREMIAYGFNPVASCGMGQNLYVEPDGAAYPCYAWHGEDWLLGYVNGSGGLHGLVRSEAFCHLGQHSVNTNRRCSVCALRYLCGGACRAWNRQPATLQTDLDAPPLDCSSLHRRARSLLLSALDRLCVESARWTAAGLPLPDAPPEIRDDPLDCRALDSTGRLAMSFHQEGTN